MKIVFFGTPDFAVPFLISLRSNSEVDVEAVVTQPDKPVGRKKELTAPPIKVEALNKNMSVLQPASIKNNSEFINLLKSLNADFFVVIAYGMIFSKEMLEIPKYGCINVHASLLPKYRGASPIQSALLNGDDETGIAIMHMSEKLDTGDIYLIKKMEIKNDDNYETLALKLSEFGAILLPTTLRDVKNGELSPIKQDDSKATYCKKFTKQDAMINPVKENAKQIINKLRAFTPWPGIFTKFKEKRLRILKAAISDVKANPGELIESDSKLILGTIQKSLELIEVQLEGKKASLAKDFINGFMK